MENLLGRLNVESSGHTLEKTDIRSKHLLYEKNINPNINYVTNSNSSNSLYLPLIAI